MWLYTTNSMGGNAKIRSVYKTAERRQAVQAVYKRGGFAYSKWELSAGSPIFRSVGALMDASEVRNAIARAVGLSDPAPATPTAEHAAAPAPSALGNISDYFVTAYTDGDFLSTHGDGASGSLAWVLHLSHDDWAASSGGALRFNPGSAVRGNRDFVPSYNRMLLFFTRPHYTPHQACSHVVSPWVPRRAQAKAAALLPATAIGPARQRSMRRLAAYAHTAVRLLRRVAMLARDTCVYV